MKTAEDLIRLLLIVAALAAVAYLAVMGNEQAQGAMIGVVSAGVGWAFRGKIETPK